MYVSSLRNTTVPYKVKPRNDTKSKSKGVGAKKKGKNRIVDISCVQGQKVFVNPQFRKQCRVTVIR